MSRKVQTSKKYIVQHAIYFSIAATFGIILLIFISLQVDVLIRVSFVISTLVGAWLLDTRFPTANLYVRILKGPKPFSSLSMTQKKVLNFSDVSYRKYRWVPYICASLTIIIVLITIVFSEVVFIDQKFYFDSNFMFPLNIIVNVLVNAIIIIMLCFFISFMFSTWFIYECWQLWNIVLNWRNIIEVFQPQEEERFNYLYMVKKNFIFSKLKK